MGSGSSEDWIMRKLQLYEGEDTLKAVIYDIYMYGESDPIMMYNLKREYDNMIGKSLILQAVDQLNIIIDMNVIIDQFRDYKIKVN